MSPHAFAQEDQCLSSATSDCYGHGILPKSGGVIQPTNSSSTRGIVAYQTAPDNGDEYLYRYFFQDPPQGQAATNSKPVKHETSFTDIRSCAKEFSLEENGFELHKINAPSGVDWESPEDIQHNFYPSVEALLRRVTRCSRVHVFEELVRHGKVESSTVLNKSATAGEPLPHCHVDFSAYGGVLRLEQALPLEAEKLKKTPFAIVQVWRPIVGPVVSSPLGLVDVSTVDKADYLINRLLMPDRMQETYHLKHNPKHRWYYARKMMPDEAYVFVNFDSRTDRARFCPHAAFQDLAVGQDAAPRQSVEVRAFCFWEDLPEQNLSTSV